MQLTQEELKKLAEPLCGEGFFVVFTGLVPDCASLDELGIRIDIPADVIAKEVGEA
jgi:hypothetical protein